MREQQEHSYTVTYWKHTGKGGLTFDVEDKSGKKLDMLHIDRSVLHM